MFLSIDGTFWLQVINFFVFYAILNVVFLKPVGEALRKRREHINSVQSEYERFQREVREAKGAAEDRRFAARREAEERHTAIRAEAQREAEGIVAAASGTAMTVVEQAHRTVAGELAQARSGEDTLVRELASTMVDHAVGSSR